MKLKIPTKVFITILFLLFLSLNLVSSQNIQKDIGSLNRLYIDKNYYSFVETNLSILDNILLNLEKILLDSIPLIQGYTLSQTNTYSRIYLEKGNYEIEIYSQKTMTNITNILTLTIDATVDNFQKGYNLYKAYEFLTEKTSFKIYTLTNRGILIPVIIESKDAYLLFPLDESKTKGFSVKLDYTFNINLNKTQTEQLILGDITKISDQIPFTSLKKILK